MSRAAAEPLIFRWIVTASVILAITACRDDQPVNPGETTARPPTIMALNGSGPNGTYHYAKAQGGSQTGDGALPETAWTLDHAFDQANTYLSPGDTVWLLGSPNYSSDYIGTFDVTAHGTPGHPIVYKQAPGQTARIVRQGDFNSPISTLRVSYHAVWTEFRDFEILNSSNASRTTDVATNGWMSRAIYIQAPHTKFVNLILHDNSGISDEPSAGQAEPSDVLISGCIIYNNGWDGPSPNDPTLRGHGHGLYLKNNDLAAGVTASDNIIFNNFGHGIQIYTNLNEGGLRNITLRGNVVFNNGTLSKYGTQENVGYFGEEQGHDLLFAENRLFFSTVADLNVMVNGDNRNVTNPVVWRPNLVYRRPGQPDAPGSDRSLNYVVGGSPLTQGGSLADGWTVAPNENDITATTWTGSNLVLWRPTEGDPNRANVVIYASAPGTQSVSLPGFLSSSYSYEVRNAQALGTVVLSGQGAGSFNLPLAGVTPPMPIGITPRLPINTGPYFNVFVVTRFPSVTPPPLSFTLLSCTDGTSGGHPVRSYVTGWDNGGFTTGLWQIAEGINNPDPAAATIIKSGNSFKTGATLGPYRRDISTLYYWWVRHTLSDGSGASAWVAFDNNPENPSGGCF